MSVFDDLQQQVAQAGASAAQGALQQVQVQLPGVVEQASQQVQAQLPAIQQAAAPAVRDLGHEGGAAVREGATGFDTATVVGGGLAAAAVLGGIIFAATRAGTARERAVEGLYALGPGLSHGWNWATRSPTRERHTAGIGGVELEVVGRGPQGRPRKWDWQVGTYKRWGEAGGPALSYADAVSRAELAAAGLNEALEESAEGSINAVRMSDVYESYKAAQARDAERRKELAKLVEAHEKAYAHHTPKWVPPAERMRISDDLIRFVLKHPYLLPEVPDHVLGRADKDSTLAPGSGDEPEGYRIKVNRWDLERSGRDPALAEEWAKEDQTHRTRGIFAVHEVPAEVSRMESASRRSHWGGHHVSWPDAHEWSGELEVTSVPLDRGGYTKGKYPQYFGTGEPLYSVQSDDGQVDFHVRANGKVAAKAEVRRCYPNAKVV